MQPVSSNGNPVDQQFLTKAIYCLGATTLSESIRQLQSHCGQKGISDWIQLDSSLTDIFIFAPVYE